MKTNIEMAREAGIEVTYDPTETPTRAFVECWIEELDRLIELVRADERERLMAGVEMPESVSLAGSYKTWYTLDQLRETVAAAVARKDAEIFYLNELSTSRGALAIGNGIRMQRAEAEVEQLKVALVDQREACAKLVDHILKEGGGTWGDAIRARGNT